VATREELEALSTPDLYNRATKYARRHADVRFFWQILQALPAAEATVGNLAEGESDVHSIWSHLNDRKTAREGPVADVLRPMYIDYILEHEKS
jgi:hypothetical protein